MNILIFSWRDLKHPLAGGAEQVMHEHAKGWIKAGHTVTHFGSWYKDAKSYEVIDGVDTIRYGSYFLGTHISALCWYLLGRHKKFDLVIDEFHGIPFFTPLYVRVPKLAVVQEVAHEVWFMNYFPWPFNWIIGSVGYFTEPIVFLLYSRILFMVGSQSAKDDLIRMKIKREQITIVPHGVIAVRPKPFPHKEKIKTVVFLGVISRDKGIEEAIECFREINERNDFKFWVIGRPESLGYFSEIKKKIKENKMEEKIKFWGFVDQAKKFDLLARAHVLVNPSAREGWGLVNIEANSVGTPVVAYKAPGLVDSVKDGESGLISKDNNPQDIAEKIKMLLEDENLYLKLQKGAMRWSRNFRWVNSQKLSLKLVERIVHG